MDIHVLGFDQAVHFGIFEPFERDWPVVFEISPLSLFLSPLSLPPGSITIANLICPYFSLPF